MSSLGPTFFRGLFNPQSRAAAKIISARMSLLYGIAILATGSLLCRLSGALDRVPLRRAITATMALFVTGTLLAADVQGSLLLLAAFFLLCIGGQRPLTQLDVVLAARNGGRRRRTTIARASMGVILGEALLPADVIAAMGFV